MKSSKNLCIHLIAHYDLYNPVHYKNSVEGCSSYWGNACQVSSAEATSNSVSASNNYEICAATLQEQCRSCSSYWGNACQVSSAEATSNSVSASNNYCLNGECYDEVENAVPKCVCDLDMLVTAVTSSRVGGVF
uniref:Uncharacterized protein n=1 Tax=Ditylenchus dipsaci TaxID=166011 RepID=A0A915EGE8_9BILA